MMRKRKLDIVYEDGDILVVNKRAGLLSISTDNEKEKTLFHEVYSYIKSKNKNNKIFIVHRLDKDTSGIMVFAKSEVIKRRLQDNWDDLVKLRQYVAVVEGKPDAAKGRIVNYLTETKTLMVYKTNKREGKLAITNYRTIMESDDYTMLALELETGRKNQIRVHLAGLGTPIIGDGKYGSKSKPIRRMGLHANKVVLVHPKTENELILETDIPNQFINLFS